MKKINWPGIVAGIICCAQLQAGQHETRVNDLTQRAEQLGLASQTEWLQLLHYKAHVFGGVYSQADDEKFFLSNNGVRDAAAELHATLHAFFYKPQTQCRFPARKHWLNTRLDMVDALPEIDCKAFEQWKGRLNAQSVSLVFPAMFLGNPASMFGHTFLRLNSDNQSPLLNYTLSYAAKTDDEDDAISYVLKGLGGGYPGRYRTVLP